MGMHIAFVAAKCSVAQLREAFATAWTQLEIIDFDDNLRDPNAMWAWKESHEKFVSAASWTKDNPGKAVYLFCQDGPWAIMFDTDYTLAANETGLRELSSVVGIVVSFIVETSGGCAFFWCYENGALRRRINKNESGVSAEGSPLPEETGIDISDFYMEETEALWRAFGISRFTNLPTSVGCQAICVIDHTDYGDY